MKTEGSTTIQKWSRSDLTNQNEKVRMTIKIGIYKITNILNNKIYIGSSNNIEERLINHKSMLRNNSHTSIHLQRAYNKSNIDNFKFEILEECDLGLLNEREQYYLDTLLFAQEYIKGGDNRFVKLGYNIKPIAGSNRGYRMTDEQIHNILLKNGRRIYAIDKYGGIIGKFISVRYVKEYFRLSSTGPIFISANNKQLTKILPDVGFIYESDYHEGYIPKPIDLNRVNNPNYKNKGIKKIYSYNIKGELLREFDSQTECANYYGINTPNLCRKINKLNKKRFKLHKNDGILFINDRGKYIIDKLYKDSH